MFDERMKNSLQGLFMLISHQFFLKNYHQLMNMGIHPGQLPMLQLLACEHGLTQREIAKKLNVRPPTVTMTIKRLEKSGLVCRMADESDRRISRISLTELGYKKTEEIHEIVMRNEEMMFQGFSESERCLLQRFFKEILKNLEQIEIDEQKERTHD